MPNAATIRIAQKEAVIPRWLLVGMAGLALVAILAAGFARQTGIGSVGAPESPVVASVELRFADRDDGAVLVFDGAGRLLDTLAVSTEGFIRGTVRALVRDRKRAGLGPEQAFRLTRAENGRLSLSDPATGGRIALDAFGTGNAAAFARYLPATEKRR